MKLEIKDVAELNHIFRNAGRRPGQDIDTPADARIKLEDALSVPNAPSLFPKVIQNVVREAIEPLLIGASLLQRIEYKYGQTITFGATGSLYAADLAEGQEYPEQSFNIGSGVVTANIGKCGVAVKVTQEMLRYSQFDVIGMHLRAAGRALARHKEVKIWNMLRNLGIKIFDNADPTNSLKGVTTGRDLSGAANGSLTMDDLFDAWAQVVTHGFMPNTLIMHPLTWAMFAKDPTLRALLMAGAPGGAWWGSWAGSPLGGFPQWANSNQGGLGPSYGQNVTPAGAANGAAATSAADQPQTLTSAPQLPSYAPMGLSIIVSPFVNFDATRKLTDIFLCDRSEIGFLVVDEEPTTEEFDDPRVDIKKIKIRERYALAMKNEGQGVAVMKNIKLTSNEIVLPGQVKIDSSAITPISPTQAVV